MIPCDLIKHIQCYYIVPSSFYIYHPLCSLKVPLSTIRYRLKDIYFNYQITYILNKDNIKGHPKIDTKWLGDHSPTQRSMNNSEELGPWEVVLPREEHTNWFYSTKWTTLKTCLQVTLYRLNRTHTHTRIYTYMYTRMQ